MADQDFSFAAWRQRLGLTQAQAADYLGKTTRSIQNFETAKAAPDHTLALACRYLEQLIGRPPELRWETAAGASAVIVHNDWLRASFPILANSGLSLSPVASRWHEHPHLDRQQLVEDATRAAAAALREQAALLVQINGDGRTLWHPTIAQPLIDAGLIVQGKHGYILTPQGRQRAGLRGRGVMADM